MNAIGERLLHASNTWGGVDGVNCAWKFHGVLAGF